MYNSKKISNKNFIDDSSLTKGFQPNSIIYEDPELTTTIQNDDPLLRTFQKFQKKQLMPSFQLKTKHFILITELTQNELLKQF